MRRRSYTGQLTVGLKRDRGGLFGPQTDKKFSDALALGKRLGAPAIWGRQGSAGLIPLICHLRPPASIGTDGLPGTWPEGVKFYARPRSASTSSCTALHDGLVRECASAIK
jgi:hypothetical protein